MSTKAYGPDGTGNRSRWPSPTSMTTDRERLRKRIDIVGLNLGISWLGLIKDDFDRVAAHETRDSDLDSCKTP